MPAPVFRALVTGASAGIGEAFARHLADQGVELVLVARREDRLRELAARLPVPVEVLPADLTDRDQLAAVEARLATLEAPVDVLVNNAGFGAYGAVEAIAADTQAAMVDVNVTALVRSTRAVLPQLRSRDRGGVINVGSTAGYQPDPHAAVYGATKAFVASFTEALHEELRGSAVHALLLAPGITRTEFQGLAEVDEDGIPGPVWMEADAVVSAAMSSFTRGDAVCVPGLVNRVAATASGLTPTAITRRISGFAHRRFAAR